MDDPELARIREQRMKQLQAQYGQGASHEDQNAKAQEQAKAMEETKNAMLSQILDQNARARLNTIKLGKSEKGQMVESLIIQMAQRGQLRGKIDEEEFIRILQSVNQQMPKSTTSVNFRRRKDLLDSDEED